MMRRKFAVLLSSVAFLFGCGGSTEPSTPVTSSAAVGTYVATSFLITTNGVTLDELQEGVTLTITLHRDGTTTGSLLVPAASDVPLSLAGSWLQVSDTVHFSAPIESFLDQLPFRLADGSLEGDGIVGPGRIQVTLTRTTSHHVPPRIGAAEGGQPSRG